MEPPKQRDVALKMNIGQMLRKSSQESPEQLERPFRVNVIAAVLQKEKSGSITTLLLDDGSGRIVARCFEESDVVENVKNGDTVLVVGRLRKYNNEQYLSLEIVRKISWSWMKLRARELSIMAASEIPARVLPEPGLEEEPLPRQKIIQAIKSLDEGEGVMIEEIIEKVHLRDMDQLVTSLLEAGDIYQIRPGRVKVL